MRIESTTVENHRFGVARRKGYDPAEVDAVMSRVADTLAQYERMLHRLESAADSARAAAADGTEESRETELLSNARAAAGKILETATEQAEAIRNEAMTTADQIIGAADDHLAAAQVDAQRIREEARSLIDLAHSRSTELRSQAEMTVTSAIEEAERIREEAETFRVTQASEAEQMLHFAQTEANRIAAETTRDADDARAEADSEVADVLAQARQQAESMINSAVEEARGERERARSEIDETRASAEGRAEEIVATARNESAEIRAAAAATAEALTAQGRVDAADALAAARQQALEHLTAAQEEAEELLNEAGREADATMAAAREDNRRLESRMEQLRTALAEFEAHIVNLAEVAGDRTSLIADMIGREIKSPPVAPARPERRSMAPQPEPEIDPDAELHEQLADPDGSGQLPAQRPPVTTSTGVPGVTEGSVALDLRPESTDEEEFVYDGAVQTTHTIYERRGGIKRRVEASQTPDQDDLDSPAG